MDHDRMERPANAVSMQRVDRAPVRDPQSGAVIPSCWTMETPEDQVAAAEAALAAMPAEPGLLRFSIFRGIDDLTLFILSQWTDEAARDAYILVSGNPRAVVDSAMPNIQRDWREPATPYRSFVSETSDELRCLVVIRAPLDRPDPKVQRDWADSLVAALESNDEPIPGLGAATLFLSSDGGLVLNVAEWTTAEAHRAALQRGGERLGKSPEWDKIRSFPGVPAEGGDVRRYEFYGAVEPMTRCP